MSRQPFRAPLPLVDEIRMIDLSSIAPDVDLEPLRTQIVRDLDGLWGGTLRRLSGPAPDRACASVLVNWLAQTRDAYASDPQIAHTEDWRHVAEARAALYGEIADRVRRYVAAA